MRSVKSIGSASSPGAKTMSTSHDSDSASTGTSSDDENEVVDLDEQQIRLAQMRRTAQSKKAGRRGLTGAGGLQTYEEMHKEHGMDRMVEGVTKLLQLHTPYELSSVCGVLGLSVKEKASTSINMILQYVKSDGGLTGEKLAKLLENMWEAALWEYLRVIGHPCSTTFVDPKKTVLKIWKEGGILSGEGTFVPHFLVREVKKRYEWIRSADIQKRLDSLREFTEGVKRHERNMVAESDFTHITKFLKNMKDLREKEEKLREYLIGELENARARLDSVDETLRMSRDDMIDLERQLVVLTDALNERFANLEFAAECGSEQLEKKDMELHRLSLIVESFIDSHRNRMTAGGGTAAALKLRELEGCTLMTRRVFDKLVEYRDLRDENDDQLRERCREHVEYIDLLEERLQSVEAKAEYEIRRANREEQRALDAERDVKFSARKIMEMNLRETAVKGEAWESSTRWMLKCLDAENRIRKTKKLLAAGMLDTDRTIIRLCGQLNNLSQAIAGDELKELENSVLMLRADAFSARHRKYLKDQEDLRKRGSKPKKTVVSSSKPEEEVEVVVDDTASELSKSTKASKGSKGGKSKGGKGGGKGKSKGEPAKGGDKKAPAAAAPAKGKAAAPAKKKK